MKQFTLAIMLVVLVLAIFVSSSQTDVSVSKSDFVSAADTKTTANDVTTTTTTATTTTTTQAKATKKTKNKATTAKGTKTTKVKGAKTTKATTTATTAKVTKATTTTSTTTKTTTATTTTKKMVVKVNPTSHVNLRFNPGGRKRAELKDGDVVIVFDLTSYKGRQWAKVTVEKTGQEGWMWASFLADPETTKATTTTSTTKTTSTTAVEEEEYKLPASVPRVWNDRDFGTTNSGEEFVETEIVVLDWDPYINDHFRIDIRLYRVAVLEGVNLIRVDTNKFQFEIYDQAELISHGTLIYNGNSLTLSIAGDGISRRVNLYPADHEIIG